jgi:hypothetical protein
MNGSSLALVRYSWVDGPIRIVIICMIDRDGSGLDISGMDGCSLLVWY